MQEQCIYSKAQFTIQALPPEARLSLMNRQKKIKQIQNKRSKQAKAKLNPLKKPAYISKADRAKIAEEEKSSAIDTSAE